MRGAGIKEESLCWKDIKGCFGKGGKAIGIDNGVNNIVSNNMGNGNKAGGSNSRLGKGGSDGPGGQGGQGDQVSKF